MQVRKLPLSQGLAWFRAAVDLGGRNPKAVFGAALLFIVVLQGLMLALAVLLASLFVNGDAEPTPSTAIMVGTPLYVAVMVLMPILIGGLMHVIREAESGRPVRARDLFAPFRNGQAKGLAALGLLQIAFGIVGLLLVTAIAGPNYWNEYMAAMKQMMSGVTPEFPHMRHEGLLFLVQLVFNYFTYAIMLLSVPLVMFSKASLLEAVGASLGASVRNVGANLLAAGLFAMGTLFAAIIALLLAWLAGLVGNLVHASVGALLSMMVLLGFGAALMVVLAGGAYLAWRDTFDAPGTQPPPFGGIEA